MAASTPTPPGASPTRGSRPAQHRAARTSRARGRSADAPTSRRARGEPHTRLPVHWAHRRAAGFKALLHRRVWSRPPAVRRSGDLRPSMGLVPPRGCFARARGARHGRGRELRSTLAGEIPPRFAAGCRSSRLRSSGRTCDLHGSLRSEAPPESVRGRGCVSACGEPPASARTPWGF